jgi:tetratricopeptide (TPR) repeat protein
MLLVAALLALGLGIHSTSLRLEQFITERHAAGDVGPLPNGKALRVISLGFERLVADLFWLRTGYYIGDEASGRAGYPAAGRLAELVTDIDPYFTTAYVIMNSVLAELRRRPEDAIPLLEKGLRYNDHYWRLHFLQGFNYFFARSDFLRAAEHIGEASTRGGPDYLPLLATRLYAEAGQPETAIAFVKARLLQAESPQVQSVLEERLRNLVIKRDLLSIDEAIEGYRAIHGAPPSDVAALAREGHLNREPLDPEGNPYRIRDGQAATVLEYEDLRIRTPGG